MQTDSWDIIIHLHSGLGTSGTVDANILKGSGVNEFLHLGTAQKGTETEWENAQRPHSPYICAHRLEPPPHN